MSTKDTQPRTTLTGQPIKYQHDALTSVAAGDAGFSSAGGNRLPVGYTDDSVVRIPIKLSDVPDWDNEVPPKPEKKQGFFRKMSGTVGIGAKGGKEEIRLVPMRRGDYLKYWAKGDDGKFLPTVVEPAEGRKEWLRKQLEWELENRDVLVPDRSKK